MKGEKLGVAEPTAGFSKVPARGCLPRTDLPKSKMAMAMTDMDRGDG